MGAGAIITDLPAEEKNFGHSQAFISKGLERADCTSLKECLICGAGSTEGSTGAARSDGSQSIAAAPATETAPAVRIRKRCVRPLVDHTRTLGRNAIQAPGLNRQHRLPHSAPSARSLWWSGVGLSEHCRQQIILAVAAL